MNIRIIILSLIATVLGTGVTFQLLHRAPRSQVAEQAPERPSRKAVEEREDGGTELAVRPEPLPRLKPPSMRKVDIPPVKAAPPAARKQPDRQSPEHPDPAQYWKLQAKRFNSLLEQLAREQDPSRRQALIRALAGYVRIDTLGTLDWAMGLQDPIELRAALAAINHSSLSGIGARIGTDDTGFPIIRETTVLSAIAATGLVEPGDYIVGMVDPDGRFISFEQLSIQQVVQHLRGPAGSEIQVLIERVTSDGNSGPHTFYVPVQRSLLVVHPPY